MKVYVVMYNHWEDTCVSSVWSTREAAEVQAKKDNAENLAHCEKNAYYRPYDPYDVDEWDVQVGP